MPANGEAPDGHGRVPLYLEMGATPLRQGEKDEKNLLNKDEKTLKPLVTPMACALSRAPSRYESTSWTGPCLQILAAMFASLAAVSIGFITGYSSLVLPQLVNDTSVDYDEARHAAWFASVPSITSLPGSVLGSLLMDRLGPRKTLLLTALPCALSWSFVAFGQSMAMVFLGRCLTGVFLGVFSPVPQVYATEVAEPKYRGMLGAFPEAAVALGSLLCYVLGDLMTWRHLAIASALVPCVPLFLSMLWAPESPQWLIKTGRLGRGEAAIRVFRGANYNAKAEVHDIRDNIVSKDGADISVWAQLRLFRFSRNWKPILLVFLTFMCGQFSGFAVVVNYTVDIFDAANTGLDSNTCTILVGLVRFLSTLVSAVLLDRVGRRPLLAVSAVGSSVGMAGMAAFFWMQQSGGAETLGWLPLASLLLYVVFNELGYGPVPWLLSGELIPLAVRTLGNGVAVTAYSLFAFIISLTFPSLQALLSTHTTFLLYAVFSLAGVVVAWVLPETKGKTLEEIEEYFDPESDTKKKNKARNSGGVDV